MVAPASGGVVSEGGAHPLVQLVLVDLPIVPSYIRKKAAHRLVG
jgi:hypothetical protein